MDHLESLIPGNTDVNDAGLETIKGLTHLQNLSLWETKVTDAGVEDLQKACYRIARAFTDTRAARVLSRGPAAMN